MMNGKGRKSILITGAGKGFGKLIAETLALEGHRVFATIRDISGKNADTARNLVKWGNDAYISRIRKIIFEYHRQI